MDTSPNYNRSKHINNNIKCTQVNLARSKNAFHELCIDLANVSHDIVFIQEPYTGKTNAVKNIPGYTIYQYPTNCPVKAVIALKEGRFSSLGITEHSNSNTSIVQINTKNARKIFLTSIYVEPRHDTHNTIRNFEYFLQKTFGSMHIVCGDFNGWHCDWGSPSCNRRGNQISNIISSYNLRICNIGTHPTYVTVTHSVMRYSIIDLTLVSDHSNINITDWYVHAGICPSSDHHAIKFNVSLHNITLTKNKRTSTFKYNTDAVNWHQIRDSFTTEIGNLLPKDVDIDTLSRDGIDQYIADMTAAIQTTCDKMLPRPKGYSKRVLWWNQDLEDLKLSAIRVHHKLCKYKRRKLPIGEVIKERDRIRREYQTAMNNASTASFKEFCSLQKKENVWSITNRIIQTKPMIQPPSTLTLDDGTYSSSSTETAYALINRFYPDDTPDTTAEQQELRSAMYEPIQTSSEPPFSMDEIIEHMKNISHKRAPGPDGLTSDICLQFCIGHPAIISKLLNRCLQIEYFPSQWKTAVAKIIPKPNKNTYNELSSFRPIGLINVFAKLLEKLIIGRLTYYMANNNKASNMQYGFKQQTSTIQAIHSALEQIKLHKSNNEHVIVASLDIKSAFDNAWWPAIFRRLRSIDCPKNIYNILISYINNRKVQINFADVSVNKTMTRGCVQGSVCGPTLWNLILDDLLFTKLPDGCRLQAYADDVLLIAHHKVTSTLENIVNNALDIIYQWGTGVKLEFGPQKTQVIGFSNKSNKCNICINSKKITFTNQIKYLGVIIDNKLKFIKHSDYVIDKAKKLFFKLSTFIRPTWGVHPDNVKTIYKQVIEPIICYASGIWSDALRYKHVTKKLLSLQRLFAIKIIQGFRTVSTIAAISIAQLTPLPDKINEVADIDRTRLQGYSSFLPHDLSIETTVPPNELLHPAHRKGITFHDITTVDEYDAVAASADYKIFTDGSKHDDRVGAAFVVLGTNRDTITTRKFKLHDCCSVFQAELLAILRATEFILENKIHESYIFSDSMSGLTELQNPNSYNYFAAHIHNNLHYAEACGLNIKFNWVKAHIGIAGNEIADKEAKAAALLHKCPDHAQIPLSYVKYRNKTLSKQNADKLYSTPNKCNYTKKWLNSYDDIGKYTSVVRPYFPITQFLTNHGYHKEYLHRFKITSDDRCPCDKSSIQSMEHLIKHCSRFADIRNTHITSSNIHNIDPYCLSEIITDETVTDTFHSLIYKIIKTLKNFNKD